MRDKRGEVRDALRQLSKPLPKRFHRRRRGGATMKCERCGGRTKVKRTTRVEHTVLRVRKCEQCGHVQHTKEVIK